MKTKLLVLFLCIVLIVGLVVFRADIKLSGLFGVASAPAANQVAARQVRGARVETTRVKIGVVNETVEAVGTLTANETVLIAPEVAGRITALDFEEGREVKQDHVLVELDASILEAELKQAQADLSLAEDVYERSSQLAKRGAGTVVALEQSTAQRQAAQVRVELARTRLEKTRIRTPFAGIAGLRTLSVGNFVNIGQTIATVTSVDPIKLDFRVPELFLSSVHEGQIVDVTVDALKGRAFKGSVYAIDPVIDVNGRALRVRARIANKDRALAPGLFARATLTIGSNAEAILMPESALVAQVDGGVVFVIENGVARRREVKIGKRIDGSVQVLDGLGAGDQVVTAGQVRLRDGAPVDVQATEAKTN